MTTTTSRLTLDHVRVGLGSTAHFDVELAYESTDHGLAITLRDERGDICQITENSPLLPEGDGDPRHVWIRDFGDASFILEELTMRDLVTPCGEAQYLPEFGRIVPVILGDSLMMDIWKTDPVLFFAQFGQGLA